MENLPLDVLQFIFRDACTDNGYTGCALSSVSKAVRSAARPSRFHSVALTVTSERIASFLAVYKQELESAESQQNFCQKPRISHLHLSLPICVPSPPSDDSSAEEDKDSVEDDECGETNIQEACLQPLQTLFKLATDDLYTLVITSGFAISGFHIFDRPFSRLRELTFVHHSHPLMFVPDGSTASPLFPALTHLHIVAEFSIPFSTWISHAPCVTHLRISKLPLFGGRRAARSGALLAAALGTPEFPRTLCLTAREAASPPAQRTWPSLRCVVLQPPYPPRPGWCGTSAMARASLVAELHCIASWAVKHNGLEVRVLNANHRTEGQWRDWVYDGWLDGRNVTEVLEGDSPEPKIGWTEDEEEDDDDDDEEGSGDKADPEA